MGGVGIIMFLSGYIQDLYQLHLGSYLKYDWEERFQDYESKI